MCATRKWKQHIGNIARIIRLKKIPRVHNNKMEAQMIDIVTNNVRQIGTPADEGRVYISEKFMYSWDIQKAAVADMRHL